MHNYPFAPVLYLRKPIYYVLILGFWEKLYGQGVAAVRNIALHYKAAVFPFAHVHAYYAALNRYGFGFLRNFAHFGYARAENAPHYYVFLRHVGLRTGVFKLPSERLLLRLVLLFGRFFPRRDVLLRAALYNYRLFPALRHRKRYALVPYQHYLYAFTIGIVYKLFQHVRAVVAFCAKVKPLWYAHGYNALRAPFPLGKAEHGLHKRRKVFPACPEHVKKALLLACRQAVLKLCA